MSVVEPPSSLAWLADDDEPAAGRDVLLHDPRRAWLVEAGEVVLMVVEDRGEDPAAATQLGLLPPGTLFGAMPHDEGRAILARVSHDAVLRPVDLRQDVDGPDAEDVVLGVERLVLVLLRSLGSCTGRPSRHPLLMAGGLDVGPVTLSPQHPTALEPHQVARVEDPFAWVHASTDDTRLLGPQRDRRLRPYELAPMGDADWVVSATGPNVVRSTTADLLGLGLVPNVLATLGDELMLAAARRIAAEEQGSRRAVEQRADVDAHAVSDAILEFASVLDERTQTRRDAQVEPTFAAARLVGQALGMKLVAPPAKRSSALPRIDVVLQIAQASRVRTRPVHLSRGWHRRDAGPLLAWVEEGEVPVALLRRARGYELHDPATGEVRRVDAELADTLALQAREFLRPLPPEPLGLRGLLSFALTGTRADLAVLGGTAAAVALLGLLVPILTGTVLGKLVPRAEEGEVFQVCALLALAAVVAALFNAVFNLAGLRVEGRVDARLQGAVWDRVMSLPASFFRDWTTGRLATAALGISEAREVLTGQVFRAGLNGVIILADVALILVLDVRLGLLTLVLIVVGLAFTARAGHRLLEHQRVHQPLEEEVNSRTFQLITGVAKLATAAAEARGFAHWSEAFARARRQEMVSRRTQNRLASLNAGYVLLAAAVAFVVSSPEGLDLGRQTFIIFNVAFLQAMNAVLVISATVMLVMEQVPGMEAAAPILQARPEEVDSRTRPGSLTGLIEVKRATFSYVDDGTAPVLEDVSLRVEPGEMLAIVGPSGCGKSTLLRLLIAFDEPESGMVAYDGLDLADLDPVAVRRQLGVVLQGAKVFAGDILSNVVGSGLYTHEDAWAALKQVGMDEEVAAMPMGVNTMLSDGGWTLSGGQRQRILLARALVARPRILLLDEATSALDNHSQATVTRSMADLAITRVVIAHRLSTIRDADQVIVMDGGRVVQRGTFDELSEQEGLFRSLAQRQLA